MKITKPTLLLNEHKCKSNIRKMAAKARAHNLIFRPHFKTHQSAEIGEWFRNEGVTAITVSSLGMAAYFADAGWQEITVAFPVNVLQIDLINELAAKMKLNLLIDNTSSVDFLNDNITSEVSIYVEIDSGGGRTGLKTDDLEMIAAVAGKISASTKMKLKGFYTHAGHSYGARSADDIIKVYNQAKDDFMKVRKSFAGIYSDLEFCMGDTPSCSIATDFSGIDAISPGNFVFYDVMQNVIGACKMDEIAVAMACPVVSKNNKTNEVFIYGGAIHFSKETIDVGGRQIYGKVVKIDKEGWSEPLDSCYLKAVSQEHGIVQLSASEFETINIGDVLGVLPVHSCLAAEAMGVYSTFKNKLIDHYAQKNRD